jgi:lipopolysaccharide transport system permease protein
MNLVTSKETPREEEWTEVISPRGKWFDLRLKDVWRYRDLLLLFVKRDFIAQYRQTILGPLWHFIQPIMTTVMFVILFNRIAKIPTGELPPAIFYMSSITIWNFFSACLGSTSGTFTGNAGIFGKVYFPRLISPLATILSCFVKFNIQCFLLLVVVLYYSLSHQYTINVGWHMLLLPVIIILMALTGLGGGIIISSLTTKYRDLNVLIGFGMQLLMYMTPVVYPLSYLDASPYKVVIQWNPLTTLVESFRFSLFGTGTFDIYFFCYSIGFSLLLLTVGIMVFSKVEKSFMDTV